MYSTFQGLLWQLVSCTDQGIVQPLQVKALGFLTVLFACYTCCGPGAQAHDALEWRVASTGAMQIILMLLRLNVNECEKIIVENSIVYHVAREFDNQISYPLTI